jgi:hypothetical protein
MEATEGAMDEGRSTMITTYPALLSRHCNRRRRLFIKGGFNKLCFSLKETALLAVAWS